MGWVFLSGPMGAGKSTVGPRVAEALGQGFLDLDARLAAYVGQDAGAFLAAEGEAAFRRVEAEVLSAELETAPKVVALGGGTVTQGALRRRLLREGTLVTLRAPLAVLLARVGDGAGRPLLAGDAAGRARALLDARAGAYAEAHGVVDASAEPAKVTEAVLAVVRDAPVPVALGRRSYRVEIGHGIRARLAERVRGRSSLVVADDNTAPWARAADTGAGPRVDVTLRPGEEHKDVHAVGRIWDAALGAGLDRSALVVAVGGGVVGDLAGFAAATLLRGVAFAQVPTSLLAMVDSSVGGKTGFDRPEGKNLVGAFHQPDFVLCDIETLSTLPEVERIAGLAEVVKSAWLDSEEAVAALERDAHALRAGDPEAVLGAVRRSVALKARVVAEDEEETGRRRVLNLGHTVGHALEAALGYGALRHGEAVSLGLVAAARLGERQGTLRSPDRARLTALLDALGLPTALDEALARGGEAVWRFAASDKKRSTGGTVAFIVPGAPGHVEVAPLALRELPELVAPLR
ncbi:MAG: 3-dehydroquinate synthase [Myxococcota bacterium]